MGVHCALTELGGRGVFGGSWQKAGSRGQGRPGGGQAGTGLGLVVALRHGASGHAGLGRRVHPPRAPSREELSDLTLPPPTPPRGPPGRPDTPPCLGLEPPVLTSVGLPTAPHKSPRRPVQNDTHCKAERPNRLAAPRGATRGVTTHPSDGAPGFTLARKETQAHAELARMFTAASVTNCRKVRGGEKRACRGRTDTQNVGQPHCGISLSPKQGRQPRHTPRRGRTMLGDGGQTRRPPSVALLT